MKEQIVDNDLIRREFNRQVRCAELGIFRDLANNELNDILFESFLKTPKSPEQELYIYKKIPDIDYKLKNRMPCETDYSKYVKKWYNNKEIHQNYMCPHLQNVELFKSLMSINDIYLGFQACFAEPKADLFLTAKRKAELINGVLLGINNQSIVELIIKRIKEDERNANIDIEAWVNNQDGTLNMALIKKYHNYWQEAKFEFCKILENDDKELDNHIAKTIKISGLTERQIKNMFDNLKKRELISKVSEQGFVFMFSGKKIEPGMKRIKPTKKLSNKMLFSLFKIELKCNPIPFKEINNCFDLSTPLISQSGGNTPGKAYIELDGILN